MTVAFPGLAIRPATAADLPRLRALPFSHGLPSKHDERYARQERDEALYVLASRGDSIVGHLFLGWNGPWHHQIRAMVEPCAEIEDFLVDPALRSQGIGTAMIAWAADAARARGFSRLGLAVGHTNPRARALYERAGFQTVPFSDHRVTWVTIDPAGREVDAFDDCVYMTKELS